MDKNTEKKDYKLISADLENQIELLHTLSLIQELTMTGIAADEGGVMDKDTIDGITCMFGMVRTKIIRKEFGFFLVPGTA